MFAALGKIFLRLIGGSRNERIVRARLKVVQDQIAAWDDRLRSEYADLVRAAADGAGADAEALVAAAERLEVAPVAARDWLRERTAAFRRRLADRAAVEDILPEAFATVRLASWLARNHRQFDVQLVAGQLLHEGWVAEEATGEGKTIACYPAIYLAALSGMKVHVVTVNDYLVQRDRDFAAPIFDLLDLSVGAIQQPMDPARRQIEYACHVIYGTNSEFGFDYLRDNMKLTVAEQVLQDRQDYAIVDEVDNILIDEARTPLIISGPAFGDVDRYRKADAVAREIIRRHRPHEQASRRLEAAQRTIKALEGELAKGEAARKEQAGKRLRRAEQERERAEAEVAELTKYYEVELDKKSAHLTHEGVSAAQEAAGVGSFYVGGNMEWPHLLDQSLRAHVVYERDKDYIVRDGEVVIVDEFTGRLMEGREWADGLHQAVEAKEHVPVKEENQTLATITLQNLFKLYRRLAGMTGTAMTEAEEFMKIYDCDVVSVPTHRPVNRVDYEDRIYRSVEEKYGALVEEIAGYANRGRPVLVGTTSIEKSEKLSTMLGRQGVDHEVLNGRPENAAREAEIVDLAGRRHPRKRGGKETLGNVTIATNMAGRGTDIKLGPGVVYPKCKVPTPERLAELGVEAQDLFPPGTTKCCIHCPEYDPATGCAHCFKPKVDPDFPLRGRTDCRADCPCGLHIVGTERHEARRIDNQLRGRSGRQGDPGSSRFFLSLRDELLAIFAGEWTIKVLGWLGMEEGEPIEHRRITKGIERAQKKVEQRNFDVRKHLLEMDEVMDHQRKHFYGRRQQVLEGRDIPETILEMIHGAIADAVADYFSGDYPQRCIAEWARANLEVSIRPDQVPGRTAEEYELIEARLRDRARDEAAGTISMTLGEYADPSLDRREWDLRGLSSWAMSRFGVNLSQNQLRKMDPPEMERALTEAAVARIDEADLSPLLRYLREDLPSAALAEWARSKFAVELTPSELPESDPPAAEARLRTAVEAVYLRRQIEYPVEYAMDVTIGQAGFDNVYARKALADWANRKLQARWTPEDVAGKGAEEVRDELVALSERFQTGGALEAAVDAFLTGPEGRDGGPEAARRWARERFDTDLAEADFEGRHVRDVLLDAGRAFLRRELTELERFVLLQIYDTSWKDHLLAMDHLKGGIGLRGFAEQDPKIVYKKEGFRQFQEMLKGIREKVTDIVFKARLTTEAEMESVYQVSQMVHEQLSGYDHLAQDMAAQQAAAEPRKIEQIVRETPKVGRNDPCPCGSGKKFKKCCGRNA